MIITKDVLISDVVLRLTQGKPSSDLELEKSQVAFIIDQVRWKLVTDKLNANITHNYPIDPIYIRTDENLVPTLVPVVGAPVQNKIQVALQFEPLSLYRDRGVMRVFASPIQSTLPTPNLQLPVDFGSYVDAVSVHELDMLNAMKFSKPSITNLKYRREGQTLWIYGLDSNTYKMVQFSVSYMPRMSALEDLNSNDPVPLTEDLYGPLVEGATKICFEQIYKSSTDIAANATSNLNLKPANQVNV